MVIVILGGLVGSTALTLLVLPSLALRFVRFQARDMWDQPVEPTSGGRYEPRSPAE